MTRRSAANTIVRIILSTVVVLCILSPPSQAHITVLLYHKFDEADSPSTSTPTAMFARQMAYLNDEGYAVISMGELHRCITGDRPVPDKAVVITLDDGYLSEYTQAVPILKRHGYPFCIFVFTRSVGAHNFMNWDQLKQIRSFGGEVGSHTHTHPHLVDSSAEEIEREMMTSRQILKEKLGFEPKWFAYPFGEYDNAIRAQGIKAGYKLLLTSDPGSVGENAMPDIVPRQAIVGQNMTMERFREKLSRPELHVLKRSPGHGRLSGGILSEISVTIAEPRDYYPGQVQMFLSEKGRLNTQFDPETGVLTCNDSLVLTRKVNRIITTARRRSDGLYAMYSYMIVLPEGMQIKAKNAYTP
ncbi:MAG TPA: polysaccharide deacetylase family protein [Deltaproteobacteria bacterium]|nr:polysaccharide deacetylase family protein [Deltaproteobacteria bacterium]HPJ92858.1 polysaccharide deacetylase family protein [Deltaproteobacteria bacterium]HPR51025.1 polysaccharide deacetylase family protein [Deltaproteobacteria bacterium]